MKRICLAALLLAACAPDQTVTIGSKTFTESVILGEIVTRLVRDAGAQAEHQSEFGGTRVLWNALLRGDLDIYPEYTGTISGEILARRGIDGMAKMRTALAARGIAITGPLGFHNTSAVGMRRQTAERLDITRLSDLARHPRLPLRLATQFTLRPA